MTDSLLFFICSNIFIYVFEVFEPQTVYYIIIITRNCSFVLKSLFYFNIRQINFPFTDFCVTNKDPLTKKCKMFLC